MRKIVFPLAIVGITGVESVTLTAGESKAMARIHLGGVSALQTADYKTARRTIDSLIAKGMLDRDGTTFLGRRVAESCADAEHAAVVRA